MPEFPIPTEYSSERERDRNKKVQVRHGGTTVYKYSRKSTHAILMDNTRHCKREQERSYTPHPVITRDGLKKVSVH